MSSQIVLFAIPLVPYIIIFRDLVMITFEPCNAHVHFIKTTV
jgi:hypothetical protein